MVATRTQFLPPALGILGNQYGLNPAVPELQSLFNSGRLAFLANVGPLIEPLQRSTFNSFRRPPQLYSHNDQTSLWQIGGGASATVSQGWGGRTAGALLGSAPSSGLAPCISIAGQTRFLAGEYPDDTVLSPFRMSTSSTTPATTLNNYNTGDTAGAKRREILQGLLDIAYPQAMSNAYGEVLDRSMQLSISINNEIAALSVAGSVYTAFNTAVNAIPNTSIGQQLRQVARMIAVSRFGQGNIQANRQVFYVSTGGYDTHSAQIVGTRANGSGVWSGHQGLLQQVAQAMKGFHDALDVLNQVSGYGHDLHQQRVLAHDQLQWRGDRSCLGRGTDGDGAGRSGPGLWPLSAATAQSQFRRKRSRSMGRMFQSW